MNLGELHKAAKLALAGEPDPRALQNVSMMALHLAEMVGWAPASIDPHGDVRIALDEIRASARSAFERHGHTQIATLHDAIAELADAIECHDRDLDPRQPGGADIVAM